MKESIYTIPINEAFDTDCECPMCEFIKKEEISRVEYSLGASMMEPDARVLSNQKGYCQRHTQMMYSHGNKLSHALVLETRLQFLSDAVEEFKHSLAKHSNSSIFKKKNVQDLLDRKSHTAILHTSSSCVICERLTEILEGFTNNLFHLYKNDPEFKEKFFNSKGFCLGHFELLVQKSTQYLNYDQCNDFLNKLCDIQKKHFDRVLADVNWFTRKFDYRYKDADWKSSKDAVQRACLKISGYIEE